ncbi:ScbA/BarX family gamma-butyrolactone biosynthesis protein [Streptomyces sp. NBC_00859]|uniref:ScbA/BarX family gamma-butyrolactone biosynthesis protein n=1 Tax=Streptomyces sp. NBC_00859 TaxID=2903682 RepID=UPI00386363AE|nr:transcriptional regulator [Streptomyces sp. NBC_00859]
MNMLATAARSPQPGPILTTTVAREYVHRAAVSEVFLTGWERTDHDAFRVTAQWPRFHSFYADDAGIYDPMLLCETIRQTFPLLAHAAYAMPMGYALSWSRFHYSVNPQGLDIREEPAEIELRVRCNDIQLHRTIPARMSMHVEAFRDQQLIAVSETRFGCHAPNVYQRLRRGRHDARTLMKTAGASLADAPASPAQAGRPRLRDVVLSQTDSTDAWQLRIDTAHPIFFDHPLDHAPGMLLLEAVRQCAHATTEATPSIVTGLDITFNQYVEFDAACLLRTFAGVASDQTSTTVSVEAHQNDTVAFSALANVLPL